jgi:hypothetical protein
VIEAGAADAEHPRSPDVVSIAHLENTLQVHPADIIDQERLPIFGAAERR